MATKHYFIITYTIKKINFWNSSKIRILRQGNIVEFQVWPAWVGYQKMLIKQNVAINLLISVIIAK